MGKREGMVGGKKGGEKREGWEADDMFKLVPN
jgi:hypothetical protein